MKGIITKLFEADEIKNINSSIEFDEKGKVIDEYGKGCREVELFGKVSKVDLVGILKPEKPRTGFQSSADDLSVTAFMDHRNEGANAVLRGKNGSIREALFECMEG